MATVGLFHGADNKTRGEELSPESFGETNADCVLSGHREAEDVN